MAGRRRFKSIGDCRRYLGSVLNRIEGGELDPATGGRCAYIANILISAIKDSDIEDRIKALEEKVNEVRR